MVSQSLAKPGAELVEIEPIVRAREGVQKPP
jgi:hypothetical protein